MGRYKSVSTLLIVFVLLVLQSINQRASAQESGASWIGVPLGSSDTVNIWSGYRKNFMLEEVPATAVAKIAVDSKYWLYVNGQMVVFEGGLKRGPNPKDTYYDEVDLKPYLKKGNNQLAILVWYFGKNGFSHNSSGKAALFFELKAGSVMVLTDASWKGKRLAEYKTAPAPIPNFRLPESNIYYDAQIADSTWMKDVEVSPSFAEVLTLGKEGDLPWNKLVKRPIPLFKDFGMRKFETKDIITKGDTLVCKLPYNMQFTPYVRLTGKAGQTVKFLTDNYVHYHGSAENIRGEYITKEGQQQYESLGWINGHYLYVVAPNDVQIQEVGYRETGYNSDFVGAFHSDDVFFNTLWEKARRTLYITMRDTYMDCPDRERAQWTGDAVLEAEEAFYALDTRAHALARKWLYEVLDWQREDGSLFAPVPAGNWNKELPDQILATVGYYGIWTYYLHTGDKKILQDLYPRIQRYLNLWDKYPDGLVKLRAGGWQWGDWGENKDMLLLYNLWYYLALKGSSLMADELGKNDDAQRLKLEMAHFATKFNERFWRNGAYRDPAYTGKTDDRVHALAVLAGIASPAQYKAIQHVFLQEEHASPYMEKYVFEAMFTMGIPTEALARHKKRFAPTVNNTYFTTLFEGWGIGSAGYGGGTVNHAWSGGGLTILSAYLCGIRPLSPGYEEILIAPQLGNIRQAAACVTSVKGEVTVDIKEHDKELWLTINIPEGTSGKVVLPVGQYQNVWLNNKRTKQVSTKPNKNKYIYHREDRSLWIAPGKWVIKAQK